jgi:hypothetical protein
MLFRKRKTRDEGARLVRICVTSGLYRAEIIKGKLETSDIPVLLKYESLGPVMGLTIDGLGQVEVWVPMDKEEQARALLEEDDAPLDEDSAEEADQPEGETPD